MSNMGLRHIRKKLLYPPKNAIKEYLQFFRWKILLANIVDPDQMPHYVASDQGLHCLLMTLLQVSR